MVREKVYGSVYIRDVYLLVLLGAKEEMNKRDPLLTLGEAAQRLGVSTLTVEHHVRNGRIPVAYYLGEDRRRLIRGSTLAKYRKEYMNTTDLTLREIAEMYDMTRDAIHFHFCRKRRVQISGKRVQLNTYTLENVEMVARVEGWMKKERQRVLPEIESPLRLSISRVPEAK